jgi:hypothetical protein
MSQRVPAKVLEAAAAVGPVEVKEPVNVPRAQVESAGVDEVGIGATLKRLEDVEVHTHKAYCAAVQSGDAGAAAQHLKNYKDLAGEVVKVGEKYREDQVKRRDLVPRVEAAAVLADLHGGIAGEIRGKGDDVLRAYGLPVTPSNLAKWQELVDGLCAKLQGEVFV